MFASTPRALALMGGLALLGLGACANPRADSAQGALNTLVGMPKATLLQCAGVPARTATVDGLEVLTYEATKLQGDRTPRVLVGGHFGRHWGWGPDFWTGPDGTESRSCQATFTVRDGRVAKVVYGSADSEGERRLEQCYAIVENCVPKPTP